MNNKPKLLIVHRSCSDRNFLERLQDLYRRAPKGRRSSKPRAEQEGLDAAKPAKERGTARRLGAQLEKDAAKEKALSKRRATKAKS